MATKYNRVNPETFGDMPIASPKKKVYYPQITLSYDELPESKDWEIGKEYSIGLIVKQVRMSESEDGGGKVTFDIKKVASLEDEDDDDGDEEDE